MDPPQSVETAGSPSISPPKLGSERGQISFTSISSSESGFDMASSCAKLETAPLRIKRMPLLDSDYVRQRKASVECLLSSKPSKEIDSSETVNAKDPDNSVGSPSHPGVNGSSRLSDLPTLQPAYFAKPSFQFSAASRKSSVDELNSASDQQSAFELGDITDMVPGEHLGQVNDETDSIPLRQEKPSLKWKKVDEDKDASESYEEEETEHRILSTPPKQSKRINDAGQMRSDQENNPTRDEVSVSCCAVFCSLFHPKFLFKKYSIFDFLLTLFSLGMFLFDLVTDCLLAFSYYLQKEDGNQFEFFFWITLAFIVIPSVIVQLFSLWWMFDDCRTKRRELKDVRKKYHMKKTESSFSCACSKCINFFLSLVGHVFQLAPFVRYIRATSYGAKSRYYYLKKNEEMAKHFEKLYKYEMHDVSMLRLLESFLESAPQLVLQLYIMLRLNQAPLLTVVSCIASLVSLATTMVAFQRAIRISNDKKLNLSIPACVIMFCWRTCTIAARVLAFALFLTVQPFAFLMFVSIHWPLVSFFIAIKGTKFCPTKLTEYLFDVVCGLIHIFCFLNVHENNNSKTPSRSLYRMLIFYIVVFCENSVFSIIWYFRPGASTSDNDWKNIFGGMWNGKNTVISNPNEQKVTLLSNPVTNTMPQSYSLALLVGVHGLFLLGIVFMMLYYIALHPNRRMCSCSRQTHQNKEFLELVSAPVQNKLDQSYNKRSEFLRRSRPELLEDEDPLLGRSGDSASQTLKQKNGGDIDQEEFASSSLDRTCKARKSLQQDLLVRRDSQSHSFVSDETCSDTKWMNTLFNRDKRAKILYTKQYSMEKFLEDNGNMSQSPFAIQEGAHEDPRQTDRFESIVTPITMKRCQVDAPEIANNDPIKHSPRRLNEACSATTGSHPESIVIRPGSQQSPAFNSGMTTRSVTHHGPLSSTLSSPLRKPCLPMPAMRTRTLTNRSQQRLPSVPQPVQSRDYSASMSCLMGKPQSYIARWGFGVGQNVPRVPSFSICRNEILEAIESSV